MRVGIEVGGTFTDLVALDEGRMSVGKVPSVRGRPDEGALQALDAAKIDLSTVDEIVHGSTVATNAVLERKGGRVAFVVTAGFEDLLFLQRHDRHRIYDLFYQKPVPVVKRPDILGIAERVLSTGAVETELDEAEAERRLCGFLGARTYDAVAVCLLNSYANSRHEMMIREVVNRNFPDLPVTISSDVSGEYREYERATTTTLAAYVQPVISSYLGRLESELTKRGFTGRFSVMQSNGGIAPAEAMRKNAISALLSGPAAGVVGALRQVERSGFSNIMTLDIGGTSADVCLITDGKASLSPESRLDGLPIKTPMLDINTVGAGGGSIIWIDDGGVLRVGPESAGSKPGPACYGQGGERPALTDAHVVRGTIRADSRLGGRMTLDAGAARNALDSVGKVLGKDVHEFSDNAIRVANANIVGALRIISTERGRDPRDYALVPFGGAGPLHAAEIAEDLGINVVVVPPCAGVISAYGLLVSDTVHYETLTRNIRVDAEAPSQVRDVCRDLQRRCVDYFRDLGIAGDLQYDVTIEMRHVGQAFEIPASIDAETLDTLTEDDLKEKFHVAHEEAYSFATTGNKPIEIVSFRFGASRYSSGRGQAIGQVDDSVTHDQLDRIAYRGGHVDCRFVNRKVLARNTSLEGAAVIEDSTSTAFVPPGWSAVVDDADNLVLRRL